MAEQLLGTLSSFALAVIEALGYGGIVILMTLESANIPIPSEVIMPFSGFLVAQGVFSFWPVVIAGTFGNLLGSLLNYWIAYKFGDRALRFFARLFLIGQKDVTRAEALFKRVGLPAAFVARLLPVVRTFISFPIGIARVSIWRFALLTAAGSFLWSTVLTYAGFALGERWDAMEPYFRQFSYAIVIVVLALGSFWVYHHIKRDKKKEA